MDDSDSLVESLVESLVDSLVWELLYEVYDDHDRLCHRFRTKNKGSQSDRVLVVRVLHDAVDPGIDGANQSASPRGHREQSARFVH